MFCPFCANSENKVTDKRISEEGKATRRRRECIKCGKRFTTYERVELGDIMIVKKDKRREAFSREKLKIGIQKACEKRAISGEQIKEIVDSVEENLRKKGKEIKSEKIGEMVMKKLKKVDDVAYIRFASVYRDFKDIKDFKNGYAQNAFLSKGLACLATKSELAKLEDRKRKIRQKKAEEEGVTLNPKIANYIAEAVTSNIRELEGALIKLLANASLTGKTLSLELTREVLKDVYKPQRKNISIENIQKTVSEYYNLPEDLLRSKTRKKEVANARMISMYLAKKVTNNSLKTIGLLHGGKDHSTVIHALKTIEMKMSEEEKEREVVDYLRRKIGYL